MLIISIWHILIGQISVILMLRLAMIAQSRVMIILRLGEILIIMIMIGIETISILGIISGIIIVYCRVNVLRNTFLVVVLTFFQDESFKFFYIFFTTSFDAHFLKVRNRLFKVLCVRPILVSNFLLKRLTIHCR